MKTFFDFYMEKMKRHAGRRYILGNTMWSALHTIKEGEIVTVMSTPRTLWEKMKGGYGRMDVFTTDGRFILAGFPHLKDEELV